MEKMEKNLFLKLVLLSVWSSFFLSINLNPIKFFEYGFINQTRLILPFILTFVLLALKYKDIKISNFINIYSFLFYTIFFLYIFFNFTSTENNNVNIYWPLYMFLSFFTLHNFTNSNEKELLLKLTLIIVALGFIFYFSLSSFELLTRPAIHFYGVMGSNLSYVGLADPPRSSGLARLSLILFSFLMFYFLVHEKGRNYKVLILLCFLATQCLLYHSRTVSFIYFALNILIILFYYKKFFENKKLVIFTIIIPLLVNFFYNVNIISKGTIDHEEHKIYSKENLSIHGKDALKNIFLRDNMSYKKNPQKFSSDRFYNWEKAIKIIRKNYIIGHGAQADRLLISNQSIHNSLLYVTLSGGIFAGLALILIYIYSLIICIKFFLTKAYKTSKNFLIHFSISILIIINLRSILETSFAVYSIDYLIYIIAFLFLTSELKKYD
tara:strand:- start:2409 stop:3722 length:1314 start_codon:yes stop_codon:yes gene_type:complete